MTETTQEDPTPMFDTRARDRLTRAVLSVLGDTPELRGVGLVLDWHRQLNASVPGTAWFRNAREPAWPSTAGELAGAVRQSADLLGKLLRTAEKMGLLLDTRMREVGEDFCVGHPPAPTRPSEEAPCHDDATPPTDGPQAGPRGRAETSSPS